MHFFSLNLFIFIAWLQTPSFRYNLTLSYTGCKMTTKSFYTCIRESSITIDTQSTLGILGLCFLGYIWFSEYCDQRKRANFFFGLNPTWQSMHSIQLFNKNTKKKYLRSTVFCRFKSDSSEGISALRKKNVFYWIIILRI